MRKGNLLVVDDDPTQRRMFWRYFGERHYAVSQAGSADEARRLLAEDSFDLILLDLVLKTDRCGIELLDWIKKDPRFCSIPVIAMTGHDSAHPILVEAQDCGAAEGVTKPMAMDLLELKVARLIAKANRAKAANGSEAAAEVDQGVEAVCVRVLVVEDDPDVQENYKTFFRYCGKDIAWVMVDNADDALRKLSEHPHEPFDVALIDWCLHCGTLDGFQLMKRIRSNPETRSMLAFMVTANESEADIKAAFNAGADDYVAKPFRDDELLARLRSRMKRRDEKSDERGLFHLDGLNLDVSAESVTLNGNAVNLYPTEFALLKLLLARPDRILSYDYLWHEVRGYRSKTSVEALGQQMRNLRKKLGPWGDRIETRTGQGYQLHSRPAISR